MAGQANAAAAIPPPTVGLASAKRACRGRRKRPIGDVTSSDSKEKTGQSAQGVFMKAARKFLPVESKGCEGDCMEEQEVKIQPDVKEEPEVKVEGTHDTSGNPRVVKGKRKPGGVARRKAAPKKAVRKGRPEPVPLFQDEANKFQIGQNTGRQRVYDADGVQISKSCHQCQDQHVPFTCKTGKEGCKVSICRRCYEKYYSGISYEDLMEKCPKCRGFCNCRRCLRQEFEPQTPSYTPAMTLAYAEHILKCTGSHVKTVLQSFDDEAGESGTTLENVSVEPSAIRRINCDRCSTSIPDLFRSCEDCGVDICVHCCQHLRGIFGKVVCQNCGQALKLKRQIPGEMLEHLRNIVQEYGDCAVTSRSPPWMRHEAQENSASSSCEKNPVAGHWSTRVDKDMVRLACDHPDPEKRYVFCPTRSQLESDEEAHQIFQECMRQGEPVIIREVEGVMDWRPETMCRAVVEKGNKAYRAEAKDSNVTVIDCTNNWEECTMPQGKFFNIYQSQGHTSMLKVKDWPVDENFKDRLKRHNQDFLEMLPMKEYTNPQFGPLNMHRALPEKCLPPDLGPKTYIALGREKEHPGEGDSVTKLHVDMSDALNVLVNAYSNSDDRTKTKIRLGDEMWDHDTYGNAGAVWDIIRREDFEKVSEYLLLKQESFIHHGSEVGTLRVKEPILEQMFQLQAEDRAALKKNYDLCMWHFEQHSNEAIFIPAGAPHQVRNLRSCIKVAVDFVPPESCGEMLHLVGRLRNLSDSEVGLDKLQGVAIMLYASVEAYKIKTGKQDAFQHKCVEEPRKMCRGKKRRKINDELEPDQEMESDTDSGSE